MKTFGERLKACRSDAGYTQKQLSELLDTTQQRVSEWENDRFEPSLRYLVRLTRALDVTFEELTEDLFP